MIKKQKKKLDKQSEQKVQSIANTMSNASQNEVPSDVNGSYTGTPVDYSAPEQDADDL